MTADVLKRMEPSDWQPPGFVTEKLLSWDLDLYDTTLPNRELYGGAPPYELMATAHALFETMQIRDVLKVSPETVQAFIVAVNQGYHPMPFHNFTHAVYVLHGSVLCMKQCELLHTLLRPVEQLALCIAAVGHDIGHLGVQNGFLISSNDPLALQYNDKSVLEQMHCSRLFSVLRQKGCGLFDGLTRDEYRAVRKMIIGMIMATDLSQHFEDMGKFKSRLANPDPWSPETESDRRMAAEMVLHAADLSGPARPWHITSNWSSKVQAEFINQVEQETKMGIPVSKFLQADKSKLETGFIDLFAHPVWDGLQQLLPELSDRVNCMTENYERWKKGGE